MVGWLASNNHDMAHGVEVECKIHVARCDTATHEQEASAVVLWVGVEGGAGNGTRHFVSSPPIPLFGFVPPTWQC